MNRLATQHPIVVIPVVVLPVPVSDPLTRVLVPNDVVDVVGVVGVTQKYAMHRPFHCLPIAPHGCILFEDVTPLAHRTKYIHLGTK